MSPVAVLMDILKQIPDWPSVRSQDLVATEVFIEPFMGNSQNFKPTSKYQKSFLKQISRELESHSSGDIEISDLLAEVIVASHSLNLPAAFDQVLEQNDAAHVSYLVPTTNEVIHMRIQNAHNQVGMKIWEAGLYLAEICIGAADTLLKDKVVLELGAGVGVTALLALKGITVDKSPRCSILTEGPISVVANMAHNIRLNAPYHIPVGVTALANDDECSSAGCDYARGAAGVQVLPLDWTSPPSLAQLFQSLQPARAGAAAASKRPQVDVIFAADCTYSEDISEHLVRTLETLLCPPRELGDGDGDGDRDGDREVDGDAHQPLAIVASTIRNEDTFKHFLSVLQASAVLAYEDVTDWASRVAVPVASFYIPNKESIKIIKIRRCC